MKQMFLGNQLIIDQIKQEQEVKRIYKNQWKRLYKSICILDEQVNQNIGIYLHLMLYLQKNNKLHDSSEISQIISQYTNLQVIKSQVECCLNKIVTLKQKTLLKLDQFYQKYHQQISKYQNLLSITKQHFIQLINETVKIEQQEESLEEYIQNQQNPSKFRYGIYKIKQDQMHQQFQKIKNKYDEYSLSTLEHQKRINQVEAKFVQDYQQLSSFIQEFDQQKMQKQQNSYLVEQKYKQIETKQMKLLSQLQQIHQQIQELKESKVSQINQQKDLVQQVTNKLNILQAYFNQFTQHQQSYIEEQVKLTDKLYQQQKYFKLTNQEIGSLKQSVKHNDETIREQLNIIDTKSEYLQLQIDQNQDLQKQEQQLKQQLELINNQNVNLKLQIKKSQQKQSSPMNFYSDIRQLFDENVKIERKSMFLNKMV